MVSDERKAKTRLAWDLRQQLLAGDIAVQVKLDAAERAIDGRAFRLPASEMPDLQKKIEKAAKGAFRVGVMPPMLQEVEREFETVVTDSTGMRSAIEVVMVVLTGGEVSPGHDWQYLGIIQHAMGAGNWVRVLPGVAVSDLEEFKSTEAVCQHCHTNRRRVKTFLVKSPKGEVRQVGYACLGDYIGFAPEAAARHAEKLLDLADLLSESESKVKSWAASGSGYDPSSTGFFDPEQYLAWVSKEIRESGWTSRSTAWDSGGVSTADQARTHLLGALSGSYTDLPNKDDHKNAGDALFWVQTGLAGWKRLSGFQEALVRLSGAKLIAYNDLPKLAAGFPLWQREMERLSSMGDSDWVGDLKERINIQVKINKVVERQTAFGWQNVYYMQDSDDNQMIWYSTALDTMEKDQEYMLRATIKRHEDNRGIKRTVLTNCRIGELV